MGEVVDLLPRKSPSSFNVDRLDDARCLDGIPEYLEGRTLQGFSHIFQFHSKTNIRFINPISIHGLIISQDWKWKGQSNAQDLFKDMGHQSFHRSLDILNRDERHLHINLCELRLAIRTEVFVPEAPHNLKISVKPRDHQNLFKQLGRLRKGIKMARAEAAR